jgi:hypothetical protein
VELTTMTLERRPGRLRRWFGGSASTSGRAALFLAVSMFLCGAVLASLVFIGLWRNTADEASRVRAAEAQTRAIQQTDRQRRHAAQPGLAALRTQLAHTKDVLAQARARSAETAAALAHTRASDRALVRTLTPRLQELAASATTLARQTATIQSELTALEAYAKHPGAAGLDPGYIATQASYVGRGAAAAASAAAALAQDTREAQAALPG